MANSSSPEAPLPVGKVSQLISGWIERLGAVWVEGQITQLSRRPGMQFLTLRDVEQDVSLGVTCFRSVLEPLADTLHEGSRVLVHAKPEWYTARGTLSLRATEIRLVGLGELLARLERLKRQLAGEGLFAAERKRPLPFLPGCVGLVTGRASAAERDVLEVARRRWPAVRFEVRNVLVQGPQAAGQVAAAVRELDGHPEVDVIIVARGGGSVEDLLPFSDEELCRAVAEVRTPVVSAIGHEPDQPLLDFVADLRAATPTDAAKRVVPDVGEEQAKVRQLRDRARRLATELVRREEAGLASVRGRPSLAAPHRLVAERSQELTALVERARRTLGHRLDRAESDLGHTLARVVALSPAATLERGYAVLQRADGQVVTDQAVLAAGERLHARVAGGGFEVTVSGATAQD
ncbi:exodeoxyribonuclease VII large subunit [Kitasatospora sp. NBC_01287]|uniref:exodeoxyribonuclease VII large subunit n=1 Tax=Kitasatospora sp. NBC_01287 TaxID=2903573 RepID=UPI00224E6333|nr:exodeoxyribonuclease VII large subunit [Kitasatospora sp. NBC_01287]MCX4746990.1 exodeoxyribonuclease VII large subunit [Kitasatospora sp. NBC_01287]